MTVPHDSTEVADLYEEFSERFRAHDDEAVRRIYRELLGLGRPRAEIVNAAVRLASQGASFGNPGSRGVGRALMPNELTSMDPVAQSRPAAGLLLSVNKENCYAISPLQDKQDERDNILVRGTDCASASVPEITESDVPDEIATPYTDLKRTVLPQSAIPRLACALAGIAVASIGALALLSNVSTAEKTTPFVSGRNGQEPIETVMNATNATPAAPGVDVSERGAAATSRVDAPGPDTKHVGAQDAPSSGGVVASLPPVRGQEPQTVISSSLSRNSFPSPDALPGTAALAAAPAGMASGRESRLSSGDAAVLLARGDALFVNGDLISARLFYERAANAGSGQAALRLGESYDPRFLEKTHLSAARGDMAAALSWYKRARDLGLSEATILLNDISAK
jgi:hypothetical protein